MPIPASWEFAASTLNCPRADAPGSPRSFAELGGNRRADAPKHESVRAQRGNKRVAFVVQRSGSEVNGGAETLCLQIAQRMAEHWSTEVLTTCALDYMTWDNFYPEGVEQLGSTRVRRFPVDQPRDVDAFNKLSAALHERHQH